jgi:O-antigen/teichoic acid export membrane protein
VRLAADIIAGSVSSAVSVLAGLVATPLYVALLGEEAYGVLGVFLTLQATLAIFDLGLPVTVNRLVARGTAGSATYLPAAVARLFWIQSALLFVVLAAASGYLASAWLRPATLDRGYVAQSLFMMAFALATRWPIPVYQAILMGSGRIVVAACASITMAIVVPLGAILAMWRFGTDLRALFIWFAACGLVHCTWLHVAANDLLKSQQGHWRELRSFVRASAPVAATGVVGLLFSQADKAILSKIVPLDSFGHYVLAGLVASFMYALVAPVSNALYPRFSALEAQGATQELRALYRVSCHGLASILFPAALFLVVAGEPLVLCWTRNPEVAHAVAPVLRWLAVGAAVHSIMFATYAVSQASGLEKLVLRINLYALLLSLPLTWLLAMFRGVEGAAQAWLLSHLVYFAISAWQTHRRILRSEAGHWLLFDVGWPALCCLLIGAAGSSLFRSMLSSAPIQLAYGLASAAIAFGVILFTSQRLRAIAARLLRARGLAQRRPLL